MNKKEFKILSLTEKLAIKRPVALAKELVIILEGLEKKAIELHSIAAILFIKSDNSNGKVCIVSNSNNDGEVLWSLEIAKDSLLNGTLVDVEKELR